MATKHVRVRRSAVKPARVRLGRPGDVKGQGLTRRELQVLKLMATSHTYHEMAGRLGVSDETVRSHVKRVLHKLGEPDRTQAVVAALGAGILQVRRQEVRGADALLS